MPSTDRTGSLCGRQRNHPHRNLAIANEFGEADPVLGGTVMAIFDMGPHRPFVVWRQPDDRMREGVREVLACNAYAVSEFDQ